MALPSEVTPVLEKDICSATVTIVKRGHAGASHIKWPEISQKIADELKVDTRVVKDVLAKLAEGGDAVPRRPGTDRPQRLQQRTKKGARAVGGFLAGFSLKQTANFINKLLLSPGRKSISKQTLGKAVKTTFEMVCSRTKYVKTGSRDGQSPRAKAQLAIAMQWLSELDQIKKSINGTLFVDEHTEFCVIGKGGAPLYKQLDSVVGPAQEREMVSKGQRGQAVVGHATKKGKEPRACWWSFGVCAPMMGGRPDGRRMRPLCYRGKVVGMTA